MSTVSTGKTTRLDDLDLWRGIALLSIFVNHIPGSALSEITQRNFGFSDAAETFVLIAGITAAFAYFKRFAAGEPIRQSVRVGQRVWKLYVAQIIMVVAVAALYAGSTFLTGDPQYASMHYIGPLFQDSYRALVGLATVTYQPGFFNILPLYMVLLAFLPIIMLLVRRDPWMALGASTALYLGVQLFGFGMPTYNGEDGWFFNPLAWQLLFTIGLVAGARVLSGKSIPYSAPLFYVAAIYLVLAFAWTATGFYVDAEQYPQIFAVLDFSKSDLGFMRLAHILSLAYVVACLPVGALMQRVPGHGIVRMVGRHALPVFCVGSLLSILAQIIHLETGSALILDMVVVPAGLGLLIMLAGIFEWHRNGFAAISISSIAGLKAPAQDKVLAASSAGSA